VITAEGLRRLGLRHALFEAESGEADFYIGPQHRETLDFLDRALHSNNLLVLLTGEAGSGKNATLDYALRQTIPEALVARLGPLTSDPGDFLVALLRAFGFESVKARLDEMRGLLTVYLAHQRQKGITTVIVADHPEVVSGGIIEEMNWLSLLEPVRFGRLKLVMLGEEALERQLAAPRMHALRQMIRWQHRLEALRLEETRDYLDFHAEAAGCADPGRLFSSEAVARIHALSGGLPARINAVAAHAVAAAAVAAATLVEGAHVQPVAADARGGIYPQPRRVAALDILLDQKPKARISLNASRLLIGRHPWNDVQLDHDSVSRHHAMLVREGGHWTVVDLNSTNGIRVNERETRQQRLHNGDTVQIGRFRLVLAEGAGPARSLPAVGDVSETTVLRE
jgi:type II secretory pathway predicted ATPase ExeA